MQGHRKSKLTFGLISIAILFLTACSSTIGSDPGEGPAAPQNSGANSLDPSNALPADIPITMYQGEGFQPDQEILLSELLAEGKPVVLNFWAGLCPPCRLEMPDFQEVSDDFRDKVFIFGLDVGPFTGLGSNEDGRALLQELSITYPAGTTSNADILRAYKILGMPTTYFITPDGEIYKTWTGLLTAEKLTDLIEDLLVFSSTS
jgi:thiol-disulfide isomerase/thioredoxin